MTDSNSIDDFLNHQSSERRGYSLRDWKKRGSARIWLHTGRLPQARWAHNVPQLTVYDDKRTGDQVTAMWSRDLGCWEDEGFLKTQYRRDEEGQLENAEPKRCGVCRLVNTVYLLIAAGKLDWTEPVFRFEGSTNPDHDQIIHAGGLTSMFGSDRLSKEQEAYLKSKRIYKSEAWRENFHGKASYVFCLVDEDNVGDGVQVETMTSVVGDHIKRVIRHAKKSLGDEAGNPMRNPFCIELSYDKSKIFSQRYDACRIEQVKLSSEVERLIKSTPPSISRVMRPFNQKLLRAFFEEHAVIELPWDQIFKVPQLVPEGEDEDTDFPPKDEPEQKRDRAIPEAGPPVGRRMAVDPPKQESKPDVAMIPCDKCKTPMREDEVKCKGCGAVYTFDEEPKKPTPGVVTGAKPPFGKFA